MLQTNPHLPQAMFLDLDGTLLDSLPGIELSIEHAFSACGLRRSPIDVRKAIGPPIRTILAGCAKDLSSADLDRLEAAFRASYDSDGWQKTLYYPGASQMLRHAHALGLRLFVVSNKPRHIALPILDREDLLPLFTEIVTRDSADPPYPGKQQMIDSLLKSFQLDSPRCVMVGDTAEDAHAAAAMLVPFVLMTHGYGDVPPTSPVTLRIDSFQELLPALSKEFAK